MTNIIIPERKIVPVRIMDYLGAQNHVPKVRTYAIRILYPDTSFDYKFGKLADSHLYVRAEVYRFEDSNQKEEILAGEENEEDPREEFALITDEIARKIILDFKPFRNSIEELLVHCEYGENRSPSVALALNEMFHLGNDPEEIRKSFPELRELVYDVMIRNKDCAA
jgi:predicted protein tyrosine phosphatase